jgi:hypothetical protein
VHVECAQDCEEVTRNAETACASTLSWKNAAAEALGCIDEGKPHDGCVRVRCKERVTLWLHTPFGETVQRGTLLSEPHRVVSDQARRQP